MKVFIIAEAGVNHNGSLKIATRMINAAKKAGADAIKFQAFIPGQLASRFAPKASYQKRYAGKSQLDMLKGLSLDENALRSLKSYCAKAGIKFLSSAFDLESIDMLKRLKLDIFKVPSGEITNKPYLRKIGSLGKKVFLSTGMSNLTEVRDALNILTRSGTKKSAITVLQCNTEYPTPLKDANLAAISAMKKSLVVSVGYSDHTPGIDAAIAAATLGASVIEKHFTLNKKMRGPDQAASLEYSDFKKMVESIRNIEKAMGKPLKAVSGSERKNLAAVRKSIVAASSIRKGERFNENNIAVKRPAGGISPMKWDFVIGKTAKRDFKQDEPIKI